MKSTGGLKKHVTSNCSSLWNWLKDGIPQLSWQDANPVCNLDYYVSDERKSRAWCHRNNYLGWEQSKAGEGWAIIPRLEKKKLHIKLLKSKQSTTVNIRSLHLLLRLLAFGLNYLQWHKTKTGMLIGYGLQCQFVFFQILEAETKQRI